MQFPFFVSLLVGVTCLFRGYAVDGHFHWTVWFFVLGAFWALAHIRGWRWFAPVGLFASLLAAGYGLWIALPAGWMLGGAVGTLFAWNLADFDHRLRLSAPEDADALRTRHLLRLGALTSLLLAWSVLKMVYWWKFSFEWLAYVAILSALGAAYLINRIGRRDR